MAHGQKSMIAQNRGFAGSQRLRDTLAFRGFVHHSGKIGEQSVIFIERAGILGDRIEQSPQRRPRFSVHRMRVGRRHHVRPRGVHLRMNRERRAVHRIFSFHDLAAMVYQD
jgi:hypothetical protein